LRTTRANISPVWVLYDNSKVAAEIDRARGPEPTATATTSDSADYRLWRLGDAAAGSICSAIGDGPVIIADGHHRYETGLNFTREMAAAGLTKSADQYILALFVGASDPGMVILPTHRALHGAGFSAADRLRKYVQAQCQLEPLPDLASLLARVDANEYVLGMYEPECGYVALRMKDAPLAGITPVELLHQSVIRPAVGDGIEIDYYKDPADAVAAVTSGEHEVAFLLRPLRSQELMAAARKVDRLPRKSTYFWPKIPTGLVMRVVE
jgi:uncharacterized protein (DUF1015 family)